MLDFSQQKFCVGTLTTVEDEVAGLRNCCESTTDAASTLSPAAKLGDLRNKFRTHTIREVLSSFFFFTPVNDPGRSTLVLVSLRS